MNFHLTYTVLFVAMLIRRSDPTTVHRQDIESVKWPPYTSLAVTVVMKHQSNIMTGRIHKTKAVLLYLCILLLAESYAPEPNPGPRAPKYPCGLCQKACKWTTPCVCCDSCDKWFHQECLHMPSAVFNPLNDISWECCSCGMPNFSSGIFDTTFFDSSSNCSSLSSSSSNTSFGSPNATSSPTATANRNRTTEQNKRPDIPLRILIINCQSIKTTRKKGSLENMVTATNANIIIGNESWLDSTINSNEVFPNGFKVFRKDRNKQGGGVFILIADNLECDEVTTLTSTTAEMIWTKIKITGAKDLYIGSFYKPPSSTDISCLEELRNNLQQIPNNAHIWLGGDFNLGDIDWSLETTRPSALNSTQCNQLISIANDYHLEQVVRSPTRITEYTSSILDLFFTNNPTLVNKCEVIPGIGDHEAVYIENSLRPIITKKNPRKVLIYKKANYEALNRELKEGEQRFQRTAETANVNGLWQLFEETLKNAMQRHIPSKIINGSKPNKPWITRPIKALLRKLKKLHQRQRSSGCPRDRQRYIELRRKTQRIERQAYWQYIEGMLSDEENDDSGRPTKNKNFWKYIKAMKKDSSGIAPLKDNGKIHSDPLDKANILNRQYESVFTREDTRDIPPMTGRPYPAMPEIEISTAGVNKLLRNLNPKKASGPDLISTRILKDLNETCTPYLTTIFNKCLTEGRVPQIWKTATVTAIFKKGEKYKASNYRPVSLTCICCKMFEHIMVSNIMKHLEAHEILTDAQHGFRAKRSCETQLLTLTDELARGLDKRKQYDMAVLDFSKAFDRVPHERLLKKLHHYGIQGNTWSCICDFLGNRTQRVVVDGATSDPVPVVSGVPQGSVLGPLLFLLFINDLPECVTSCVRLFADDCILYREIRGNEDTKTLQKDLKNLEEWENRWGMDFHPEKCSIIRIHRKRTPVIEDYYLKGQKLAVDNQTRYLGVEITSDLQWKHHIDKITKKREHDPWIPPPEPKNIKPENQKYCLQIPCPPSPGVLHDCLEPAPEDTDQ